MNLRNISSEYNIGLDMGTGSDGWAATDDNGLLLHFKKQPTWGARLFEGAKTAAEARTPRSQRRRYVRRRWRLDFLQAIFQSEVEAVDPEFFIRLRQSRLLKEDRKNDNSDYRYPLFNDDDFNEVDYYKDFPTIYHLRKHLMETNEKADIRLIYLAFHNIVKCRGNFLREGQRITSADARPDEALEELRLALVEWCDERGYGYGEDKTEAILEIFKNGDKRPSDKKKEIAPLIGIEIIEDGVANKSASKKCNDAIAGAIVGLKAEFKNIFGDLATDTTNTKLSNDEDVDAIADACPDDSVLLFDAIKAVYSAYLLQGLLSHAEGKPISVNMVVKYEQNHEDLKLLKGLVKKYVPEKYDEFFRGPVYKNPDGTNTNIYDASKVKGYTLYNLGTKKLDYDAFAAEVKKLFAGTAATEDKCYIQMMAAFEKQSFLRRLKTSDNGCIYYQLHLEEMQAIIDNQSRFYPFLQQEREKLESLVTFRIPYYVGPLSANDAPRDKKGKRRFSWAHRKEGMEGVAITPWNWEEVIDKDQAAESFITRMTGMCTYLQGEDVLPKCSLLYEEFCVLNELNGMRVSTDGDEEHRLDAAQREGLIADLFHKYKTVNYKRIQDWLQREEHLENPRVTGGQGETGLESKMGSYIFFCKDVFHVDELDPSLYPMIEEIILWNTLFEDRKILKKRLDDKYGSNGSGVLDAEQIKTICKKRFTGWGRLSREFLTGLKTKVNGGYKSIMDVLREGDPYSDTRQGRTMVLMEVLRDDNLNFQHLVDERNKEYFGINGQQLEVNELPGSPAVRRSLNQAMKIVDEIVSIAGKAPKNIFIEVTRDEDPRNKGKRTKRRYESLKEALAKFKEESAQLKQEFKDLKQSDLDDDRLMLYFAQGGKCLYSGKPIDINKLSDAGLYEVDHIIPRSYIKDDSLENKALVLRSANQRKTDAMLIDMATRQHMAGYWKQLHDAGLIGDKKYRNLLRSEINDKALKGFVARQLVETSQMVKLIQVLLSARYPETNIVPVKAGITHDLREAAGFIKCREANDYHHAHDAYLACRVGLFIQKRHPMVYENPIALSHVIKNYVRQESKRFNASHRMFGSSGFIVNSFMTSAFDKETGEIFKDDCWDAEKEIEGIRKALNYRQCFITRMPYEDTGVFWDATIYSPRDAKMGKKLSLPVKEGLDPQKYGGYSRQQFAYFFIYEAKNSKADRVFRFEPVPVWLAKKIEGDGNALELYARELAAQEKLEFVRIERAKVLKKQLVEIDGDRFYITGKREMRNGIEVAFAQGELAAFVSEDENRLSALKDICEMLGMRLKGNSKRLAALVKIDDILPRAMELTAADLSNLLLGLAQLFNGEKNTVDLIAVGGARLAGTLNPIFRNLLSNPDVDFYIIDQSVTGMFERRTRVGL